MNGNNIQQIRFGACWALLSRITAGDPPANVETVLVAALTETNGYIPAVACEALQRLASPTGLDAAVTYLSEHRFDDTHSRRMAWMMGKIAKRV